jgi:hypothetical protein
VLDADFNTTILSDQDIDSATAHVPEHYRDASVTEHDSFIPTIPSSPPMCGQPVLSLTPPFFATFCIPVNVTTGNLRTIHHEPKLQMGPFFQQTIFQMWFLN